MSTIIKFDLNELKTLANDKNSCVVEKRVTQNLALQPWCLGNLKESIKHLLDYKIGKYDKEFDGILLSYKNLRVLQNVGTIRNDNSDIHFQVQADYFIFKPFIGATLIGIVNKKSITHLGILVHRVFNVVIPRPTEEPGNKWIGVSVQEGQQVKFRIVVLDLFGALPYIRGDIINESSLNLGGPDGDDEVDYGRKTPQMLNVTYVDFEKTRPHHVLKQNGDGPHQSPTKAPTKDQLKKNTTPQKSLRNGKLNLSVSKTPDSDTSMTDKSKKRQNKLLDADKRQSETSTKSIKKHKRNA